MEELTGALAVRLVEAGMTENLSVETVNLYVTMGALLLVSFLIGVVAVLAGVGGGVLFVPLVSALFAIHVDFIRGAGLMVALVGSVAAAPRLMRRRFSRLRISIPLALCGSAGSIVGARLGLLIPADTIIFVLGVFMILVAVQTAVQAYRAARPDTRRPVSAEPRRRSGLSERLADRWQLSGSYYDPAIGAETAWRAHRVVPAMVLFLGIGVLG
ncbi:MAG: sulfite exporter TauE/SafE family protein, partial [Spirochaeta sp.]|nr:sulfite exporter TauE/SafE family protein [Spirochaeta sp.]